MVANGVMVLETAGDRLITGLNVQQPCVFRVRASPAGWVSGLELELEVEVEELCSKLSMQRTSIQVLHVCPPLPFNTEKFLEPLLECLAATTVLGDFV